MAERARARIGRASSRDRRKKIQLEEPGFPVPWSFGANAIAHGIFHHTKLSLQRSGDSYLLDISFPENSEKSGRILIEIHA